MDLNDVECLECNVNRLIFVDLVEFNDEEGYGKYLDLHQCFEQYINLKGIEVVPSIFTLFSLNLFLSFETISQLRPTVSLSTRLNARQFSQLAI